MGILRLKKKKVIVSELNEVADKSHSVIAVDYRGLGSSEADELRASARGKEVCIKVVRNTLSKRAFEKSDFSALCDVLEGPVMLFFSLEHPGASAKLIRDFKKQNKLLEVKGLVMRGEGLLAADQIDMMADLPTKEEALACVLGVMKAPIAKLAYALSDVHARLARVLLAVSERKDKT